MCFSQNASIVSFLVGMSSSLYCYSLGTPDSKVFGVFFAFVSLMQTIDYLLWRHQFCDYYNKAVSMFGMILNHFQPILLGLLLLLYKSSSINKNTVLYILGVYLLFIIPYSMQFIDNPECTIKDHKTGFQWNGIEKNKTITYLVFLLCISALFYLGFGSYAGILSVLTFVLTIIFYSSKVGATWCFFAVGVPVLYALKHSIR